jgi:hypothetical protein
MQEIATEERMHFAKVWVGQIRPVSYARLVVRV